jgi:23S rRNA pseudouridine1911/1915/1917 synthase
MESTPMHEPRVLFERSGVIALAKPPGLATQAPPGIDSVERWLRGRLAPGAYLGIPHRLDRAVSGVLLMAATPRAARQLSRQFERRLVAKHYLAIVECRGDLPPSAAGAEWHDQVVKVPDEARARLADAAEGCWQTQRRWCQESSAPVALPQGLHKGGASYLAARSRSRAQTPAAKKER